MTMKMPPTTRRHRLQRALRSAVSLFSMVTVLSNWQSRGYAIQYRLTPSIIPQALLEENQCSRRHSVRKISVFFRRKPDQAALIREIPKAKADDFMQYAEGRMKKKVMGAVEATSEGVRKVIFADGRVDAPISQALAGSGTHIA